MKKTIYGILLLICIAAASGCSRRRALSPHPWPSAGAEADSLSLKLDRAIYHRVGADSVGKWTERMAELASDDSGLTDRARYYEAMRMRFDGDVSGSDSLLSVLLVEVDSASCPYLYNRIAWHADNSPVRDVAAYERIVARLEFFRKAGDDFLAGAHYTELGNLLKNVRDPEGAVAAYRSADSLYRAAGAEDIAALNRVNLASAMTVARDTAAATSLLRDMLADSYVMSRPDVEELVLEKLFNIDGDTAALQRLYDMQGEHPGAVTLTGMSRLALEKGDFGHALSMAEGALDAAIEEGEPDFAAYAIYAMSDARAAAGDTAGAYSDLKDAVELTDAIAVAAEPDEVAALETMRRISSRRLEAELRQSKATLRYVCAGFALFLLLAVASLVVWLRFRRLKAQRMSAVRERDSISRRLIATQIARSESERLISSVGKEIGDMSDCGRIPSGETRRIVNAIKSHAVKQSDRETFIETFGTVHPEFSRRLLEINGAFTESDLRIATYIAMGMDTKHIADTLGVRPESVKQARWRLRTKLSLAKGASLEQTLRSLID